MIGFDSKFDLPEAEVFLFLLQGLQFSMLVEGQ